MIRPSPINKGKRVPKLKRSCKTKYKPSANSNDPIIKLMTLFDFCIQAFGLSFAWILANLRMKKPSTVARFFHLDLVFSKHRDGNDLLDVIDLIFLRLRFQLAQHRHHSPYQ